MPLFYHLRTPHFFVFGLRGSGASTLNPISEDCSEMFFVVSADRARGTIGQLILGDLLQCHRFGQTMTQLSQQQILTHM